MDFLRVLFYRCNKRLLLCLAMMISFAVFPQQDTLDNLIDTSEPEKIIQLEHWFSEKLFLQKPSSKVELLYKFEQIATKKNDEIALAYIIFYRGLYVMAFDKKQDKKGIALMKQAISMAEKNKQQHQIAYFKHFLGYYYFTCTKKPVEALQNMLQAHYIFEESGYQNVYNVAGMLDRMGYVYYHLSNFNQAVKYFKMSLKYPMENPRRHIGILNSIGLSYRELAEQDSARKYFNESKHQAIIAKDTAWIGINAGDIARQYLNEKSYQLAKPLMQEYYRSSLAVNDTELIVEALTGLGEISLHYGNVDQALKQLQRAEYLLGEAFKSRDMAEQNYIRKQYLFSVFAKAWDAHGNASRSLDYLKEANKIKDSIERRAKLSKNTAIQQMFEAEQTNNRLKLLREEKQNAEMMQLLYISIGVLLAILIALLYSRQLRERKLQKQKEILLHFEKEMAESELKLSQIKLDEYVRNLRQKAELLEEAQSQMDFMRQQYQIPVEDEQAVWNKLHLATILTEDDWTRFKMLFEKVHAGFFLKLKTTYPGLTPAETRLCSLVRLGLNSHEMAAMMGISAMSIKKSRQRLRKKINLSKEQKLEDLF